MAPLQQRDAATSSSSSSILAHHRVDCSDGHKPLPDGNVKHAHEAPQAEASGEAEASQVHGIYVVVRQNIHNPKVRLVGRFVVLPVLRGREENVQPLEKLHDLRRYVRAPARSQ